MANAVSPRSDRPESDIDLWTDEAIVRPYDLWCELRDIAPAVWMRTYDIWALPRYQEVRQALADWEVFSSAQGVALNPEGNRGIAGGTISSDGAAHDSLRRVIRKPLAPKRLKALEPAIQSEADALVDHLVTLGAFDAVADLARHLPLKIVAEQVGLPADGRDRMLQWAAANFDAFGPINARTVKAFPKVKEACEYSSDPGLPTRLKPGGWAAMLWDAARSGVIRSDQCPALLNDYWGPALDTTINATSNAIWLFAQNPDQWKQLRSNPELIPHAINEVLRIESPLPQFCRVTTGEYRCGGVTIPAGSRVLLMFGSANRDERKYPNPDQFDIFRRPTDHVGFGYGPHTCVGQSLARMELKALLTALVRHIERFDCGTPQPTLNNMLRGFASLPVEVTATRNC